MHPAHILLTVTEEQLIPTYLKKMFGKKWHRGKAKFPSKGASTLPLSPSLRLVKNRRTEVLGNAMVRRKL